MARFTSIPDIPRGVDPWQTQILDTLKQNVELLSGTRQELDKASQAVLRGDVKVNEVPEPTAIALTAKGEGFTIDGERVAGLDDYGKLLVDVQKVIQDVELLRTYVNILVKQLKG